MVRAAVGKQEARYRLYVESGSWKCPDAPINPDIPLQVKGNCGAHYWVPFHGGGLEDFYCKYCYTMRKFIVDWKKIEALVAETMNVVSW